MNRTLATLGLVATAAIVLWMANPFGRKPPRVTPSDETPSETGRLDSRPPIEIDAAMGGTGHSGVRPTPGEPPPEEPPPTDGPAIIGLVIDSATAAPIVGARVEATPPLIDRTAGVRPRRPNDPAAQTPIAAVAAARTTTGPTGRFVLRWPADRAADLRVSAPGHLDETRLSVAPDDLQTISLRPGVAIHGRVRRSDGVAIEGAVVRASSTPKGDAARGVVLSASAKSDSGGAFAVMGLEGITSSLRVTHAEYMPGTGRATPGAAAVELTLVPAYRVWFRLRSTDGARVASPFIQWNRTDSSGAGVSVGVVDLSAEAIQASGDLVDASRAPVDGVGPVKVPSVPGDGTVRFTVRAPGRIPWTSEEIAMPPGGGDRTIDAQLDRDPEVGSVAVTLREPRGAALPFRVEDSIVSMRRTDGPAQVGRPFERDGALVYEGLVAGTYVVNATQRRFGAAEVTVRVDGGRETSAGVTLAEGAALTVRADAPSKRHVQFDLRRDGRTVEAFVDAASKDAGPANRSLTHFFTGPDGVVLRGLSAGRYTVHLLSPDLVADDVEVDVAGSDSKVEIHAKPK